MHEKATYNVKSALPARLTAYYHRLPTYVYLGIRTTFPALEGGGIAAGKHVCHRCGECYDRDVVVGERVVGIRGSSSKSSNEIVVNGGSVFLPLGKNLGGFCERSYGRGLEESCFERDGFLDRDLSRFC